eukprot:5519137-Heterocapsa_arctica.AAC.1
MDLALLSGITCARVQQIASSMRSRMTLSFTNSKSKLHDVVEDGRQAVDGCRPHTWSAPHAAYATAVDDVGDVVED